MDLINFIRTLLRRKWLLVFVPLVAAAAVYLLTKNEKKAYRSKAQMATGITEAQEVTLDENKENIQPFIIQNRFGNLIELVKSRPVISALSYRLILHDLKGLGHEMSAPGDAKASLKAVPFRRPQTVLKYCSPEVLKQSALVAQRKLDSMQILVNVSKQERDLDGLLQLYKYDFTTLLKELKIERIKDSDFITIDYESENPYLSAFVVNTLCQELVRYNKLQKSLKSGNSLDFFARLSEKKKRELDEKVDALKRYKLEHQIINLYEQTKSVVTQKSGVEMAREQENKKIPALEKALQNIDNRFTAKEKLFIQAQSRDFHQKIAALKDRINQLNEQYIRTGLTNAVLRDSLQIARDALDFEVTNAANEFFVNPNAPKQDLVIRKLNDELDLEMAKESVRSLDEEIDRLGKVVASYAPMEASIGAFEREISVASDVYMMILNKLNAAQFATLNLGDGLRQTEYGLPAEKAEASKRMILIGMAGVIGFILCIVVIFLLEYLDLSLKTPDQFTRTSGLELIGTLNYLETEQLDLKALFEQPVVSRNMEVFKQFVRNLRYEVEQRSEKGNVILVTGTSGKQGKTFLITVLAYAFTLTGKRILLVDTQLKNPRLTKLFGAQATLRHLTQQSVSELVSPTDLPNLDVIGCEPTGLSPSELFPSAAFQSLLQELRPQYDLIFMEGSSLKDYSDSKELVEFADKVLAIFSANIVLEAADKKTIDYLKSLGNKLMGTVFNRLELEDMEKVTGETTKQRSRLRRLIKRLIKRNLKKSRAQETQYKWS